MDLTDVKLLRAGLAKQIKRPEMHGTLRDREQTKAFEALVSDKFTDEQISHSYFKLPTAFGKTVMFSRMVRAYYKAAESAHAKNKKIIIVVPNLSLIGQTQEKLKKFVDIIATEYSSRVKDKHKDVIVTTYNSLGKVYDMIGAENIAFIVADEAHHMLGEKISKDLKHYNEHVPIIGFTATPEYEENRAVAKLLNTEIYAMDIPIAVERGILAPVKGGFCVSSIVCDLSKVSLKRGTGEYDYDEIMTKFNMDTLVTEIANVYASGRDEETGIEFNTLKAIINCPNTKIANLQAAKINEIMGRDVAVALHKVGIDDKEYDKLKEDFQKKGKYSVVCQVGTLTEGFDDEKVSLCINYPTHSRVKEEQTVGRAIRTDDENPKKIAFVLDTIFRTKPDETQEDILKNAADARQVLFNDIADGLMVLYPKDFRRNIKQTNDLESKKSRKNKNSDVELITDTVTLMGLKRIETERIKREKGQVNVKTKEWLTAGNLAKDPDFPCNDAALIGKKLKDLQPLMKDFIKYLEVANSNGIKRLCLHRDAKEEFADRAGFDLTKTDAWLSAKDLATDSDFPGFPVAINNKLKLLQPEMPDVIQIRKTKAHRSVLCLHRDARDKFLQKARSTFLPKNDGWQSADDLLFDPTFPLNTLTTINKKLVKFSDEMPNFIQVQGLKIGGRDFCLHRDGREEFLRKIGYYDQFIFPEKTEEWLSSSQLAKDPDFPNNDVSEINNKLQELQSDMSDFIQKRYLVNSKQCIWCLHRDKKDEFAKNAGFNISKDKTDEWLSAADLIREKVFKTGSTTAIIQKMKLLQPEMPDFIQMRKLKNNNKSRSVWCVHRDGVDRFYQRAINTFLPVAKGWISSYDLVIIPGFPIDDIYTVQDKLRKFRDEMSGLIHAQELKTGDLDLCLNRDGMEKFLELLARDKAKSLRGAAKAVSEKTDSISNAKTIKSVKDTESYGK